ncbi:hypothetical protein Nepgr_002992 [Nepenthes gracilis]|uniref:Uncharacterized protein n=1 Tax=Nepenthes gracilis TaxID=150966 RepID=A0AAD3XCQ2_NEPGR|nr:hypothetical protein Nepgr_002992 [Nepenthes gracilis]
MDQKPNLPQESWEARARAWLSSLPDGRAVTMSEVESWVDSNWSSLPDDLKSMSQSELLGRFSALQISLNPQIQEKQVSRGENPARFQRTDQWLPVYSWLESLDANDVIKSKDISDWLSANPDTCEQLCSRHSRYHLTHYIKKCHVKILKRREKMKGERQLLSRETPLIAQKVQVPKLTAPVTSNSLNNLPKDTDLYQAKRNEALRKYEILVELEKQLSAVVPKQ